MTGSPTGRPAYLGLLDGVRVRLAGGATAWTLAVAAILLVALGLRLHGLGWDQPEGADAPLHMHPDERFLSIVSDKIEWPDSAAQYFDTATSPLNPYNQPETPSFVYGTFPLFLAKGVSTLAGDDAAGPGDSYDTTVMWGRRLGALFDTATVLVVFAIGTTVFNRRVGLAAALLYALAVLPTQLAHFWAVDPFLVFFGALSLWLSVLLIGARSERSSWLLALALGVSLGLGVASKVTGVLFVPILPLAMAARIGLRDIPRLGLRWRGEAWGTGRAPRGGHWMTDASVLCLALAAGILAFRIAQPYAFMGPHIWDMAVNPQWKTDVFEGELDRQRGAIDFPPFVQFAGRTPFLYPLWNITLFGLGPALTAAALVGAVVAGVLLFRRRELAVLLPLAVPAIVFGFQGGRFVTYLRYFAPMYPALCLFAGWMVAAAFETARRPAGEAGAAPVARWPAAIRTRLDWRRVGRYAAAAAVVLVVGASAWWALAFQSVYSQEHPRVAASRWIYENAPPGSRITGELWDDTIPYALPGHDPGRYPVVETTPYDTDSPEKVETLVYGRATGGGVLQPRNPGLDGAEYVAITSDRVRSSVSRLEREYPATIRYYELLDSGELGFDLVAHFEVKPTFLGISVDDSGAEESFTVYDHPEVRIYRKSERWDPERAVALLSEAHPERAVNLLPKQGGSNGLQLTAEEARVQQAGGTFSEAFTAGGVTSHLPWLWWMLWVEAAAFATLPWLGWLLRAFPDRGFGLTKVVGMAAVTLATWLLVAWGGPHFSGGLAWVVFVAYGVVGVGVAVARRAALREDFAARWPSWLALECVFLAAFTFFLLLRYANPDLWHHPQGGEKPIELAFLTAVSRSSLMPPYDPWFAGGTMNYYYMGWFLLAVPMRALRILPEVGFNLGVPTFAALSAVTAASTVHNLTGLAARPGAAAARGRRLPSLRPAIIAAVLGAVLLIFIGNLDGAQQTVERFQSVSRWHIDTSFPLGGREVQVPVIGGVVSTAGGAWQWAVHGADLPPFGWWRSSRVHAGQFDITEFPYWSALFADLHPHLMGVPFFGLVIALACGYVVSAGRGLRAQTWVLAGTMGIALGLVRTVHTWDFPTAVLLTGGAVVAGQLFAPGRWQTRAWLAAAHLGVAALLLTVPFAPYTSRMEVAQSGLTRAPETTRPDQYFVHFGLFVCAALAFVAVRYREELAARRGGPRRNPFLAIVRGRWELLALAVFLLGVTTFTWQHGDLAATLHLNTRSEESAGLHSLTVVALSALLLAFLGNLLWLEWRAPVRDLPRVLATALFFAGCGIAAGVDLVTVKDDIVRMNTVFKFSLQAWHCFAIASAFAAWYVGRALWQAEGWVAAPRPGRQWWAAGATATALVLLACSWVYVVEGTPVRQAARFAETGLTLDGLTYFDRAVYYEDRGTPTRDDDREIRLADDLPLITWLRTHVEGSPVIAEAVGPLYHWTGRISVNTGLPAVIGWDWHEVQQRWEYQALVQQRRTDTARFYSDPNPEFARSYLRTYNVRYVVVGTEELVWGTAQGLAKFRTMPELTEVYRDGDYAIYFVREG